MREERGHDPDTGERYDSRETAVMLGLIKELGNKGNNNSTGHDKWTTPLLMSLLVSFILGGIALTMSFAALKQEVTDQNTRLEKLEKILEPRYRSGETP